MKGRLPHWFKRKVIQPETVTAMRKLMSGLNLHTICENALCPNIGECFAQDTATFLILGDVCTRNCTFCAVKKGHPLPVDEDEPRHLLEAVTTLGLRYVVITSVTRDDLSDGGAAHFARTISLLHESGDRAIVEVLIPDFLGSVAALQTIVYAHPEVINHNVETVPRLYPEVKPMAIYDRSVELLSRVKEMAPDIATKSGLMLGLGETEAEVVTVMRDLREAGCDLLTIGQYLRPTDKHHPVVRHVSPEEFSEYERIGGDMGFSGVVSAPLTRSSHRAAELYAKNNSASV
ncbi:lipoyl synthase [Chloroflexota bacterium]